jgi:SAM-dependent methyltransferase
MGASKTSARPFYSEYAWAFDLLIDRPVQQECGTIAAWLGDRGRPAGASILDAGCGTGRYATELNRRGYVVHGIDRSPELIAEARRPADRAGRLVSFAVGDILACRALRRYDAVLCRGVLNDFVDEAARRDVFTVFGNALRPGGVLLLDVREWGGTADRKAREPVFTKTVATARGLLTFTSTTELSAKDRRLVVTERHTLNRDGLERSSDFQFVMQCWTREELDAYLRRAAFQAIAYFGAYDSGVAAGATDRLVAVAQAPQ